VVLPDPFEPISPWICPRMTVRLMSSTAFTPPNERRAFSTTSGLESPAPMTGGQLGSWAAGGAAVTVAGPELAAVPLTIGGGAAVMAGVTVAGARPRWGRRRMPKRSLSTVILAISPSGRKTANASSSTPKTMPLYCWNEVKNWLIARMIPAPISGPVIVPVPPMTMPASSRMANWTDELPGAKNCWVYT